MEPNTVISAQDFSKGANGWSINRPEANTSSDPYLGRFTDGYVEKTYELPENTSGGIEIAFDFLEIDSWDGESFLVYINGQEVEIGTFNWQADEQAATFETDNGIIIERSAATRVEGYGNLTEFWASNDSAHAVKIFVPNPGPTLTLGFSSTLDQAVGNESFSVDNVLISARSNTVDPTDEHDHNGHDHGGHTYQGHEHTSEADASGGLQAEYFAIASNVGSLSDIDFDAQPVATQTVDAIDFNAGYGAFYDGGATDNFAARYTGAFEAPASGSFTFHLTSDDGSMLLIDGVEVISNDGRHAAIEQNVTLDLTQGAHTIEVLYFEAGGAATLDLEWSGPGFERSQMDFGEAVTEPEPTDPVEQPETTSGLQAEYFAIASNVGSLSDIDFDAQPVATQTVDAIDFNAGYGAFYDGGATDNFAARYTGAFEAPASGSFTFHLTSDDGSMLLIDGVEVISNDGRHAAIEQNVTLDLTQGAHTIEVLYFEAGGAATLDLEWSGPGFERSQMDFGEAVTEPEPTDPVEQPETTSGLQAEYFAIASNVGSLSDIDFDAQPVATQTVDAIDFNAGYGAFYDGGATDNFAARYTGAFEAPASGQLHLPPDQRRWLHAAHRRGRGHQQRWPARGNRAKRDAGSDARCPHHRGALLRSRRCRNAGP